MRLAILVAPQHPESHYNLALAYDRLGMLKEAEQEALIALTLNPCDSDVHNTLALVYAEHGNYTRARKEWSDLLLDNPEYEPAKANLAILGHVRGADSERANSEARTHFASAHSNNGFRPNQ